MKLPSRNLGLHHVAIHVPDMQEAKRFYTDYLGFAVEREDPDQTTFLSTGTDSLTLMLADPERSGRPNHIGVMVPKVTDVPKWEKYFRDNGVAIKREAEVYRDGSSGCSVADPGGNEVQILFHPQATRGLLVNSPASEAQSSSHSLAPSLSKVDS
jgi:catechol 2,3-dioxygenase-like lactoylglutathione lyase family enzyme